MVYLKKCVCKKYSKQRERERERERLQTAGFLVICRFGKRKRRKKGKSNWQKMLATKAIDGT